MVSSHWYEAVIEKFGTVENFIDQLCEMQGLTKEDSVSMIQERNQCLTVNDLIKEVVTYFVYDYEFKSMRDAEKFVCENYFIYDEFDERHIAVSRSSVLKYENMLKGGRDELFKLYRELANSNSMGSVGALTSINLVFENNNVNMDDVWRD